MPRLVRKTTVTGGSAVAGRHNGRDRSNAAGESQADNETPQPAEAIGSKIVNVVPFPSSLSTTMEP